MEKTFEDALAELLWDYLLWDYLKLSPGHTDRRMTAWGDKTKFGLAACVLRLVEEHASELKGN